MNKTGKLFYVIIMLFSASIQAKEVYATFVVYAERTASLAFNYSGTVKSYNVGIMSKVKKDDVLAELISDDLIATLNVSKVAMKYAEIDYERYKILLGKGLINVAQFDKYALQYDTIKARIEVENAIFNKTILRAPFDGVITKRMIEVGDVVSGQMLRTAFEIQSEHQRILVVEFDQKYNRDVKIGDHFIYHVDGDSKEYTGSAYKIYPATNSENRKIAVQVLAHDLKVGLFGEGKFITSTNGSGAVRLTTNSSEQ